MILELEEDFLPPIKTDMLDLLFDQYNKMKVRIEDLASAVTGETATAVGYFVRGNSSRERYSMSVYDIFKIEGAIAELNSDFWTRAINLTDVIKWMPSSRRDEWHKSIQEKTCPPFTEDIVRDTIADLISKRSQFFAERVDGIFKSLSPTHLTNNPAAFGERFIIHGILNEWGTPSTRCGIVNDLRCVISKFIGRDDPHWAATEQLIRRMKETFCFGEWLSIDGGSLRVRLYLKGTLHIEVSPEVSWKLNSILAGMYPSAIPAENRTRPVKKKKDIRLIQKPLPFSVLDILHSLEQARIFVEDFGNRDGYRREFIKNSLAFSSYSERDKHAESMVIEVLESLGGIEKVAGKNTKYFSFDYDPKNVISEIVMTGMIPDDKSFQFYPTPENIVDKVIELAEVKGADICLEPSAGTGRLSDRLPVDKTTCVEVSSVRAKIISEKGYKCINDDFLNWASKSNDRFDKIVMNPPFDRGQWSAHVEAAKKLLDKDGVIVAVLPESAKKFDFEGLNVSFFGPYQFDGVSIKVIIMKGVLK